MTGILTITLNPAVDYAASVEKVEAGPKLYCSAPRIDPGGGGVNVARVIGRLGGQVAALVIEGGAMGQRLIDLMSAEGVNTLACHMSGETRYSLAVTDEQTREQYRFSLPGQMVTSDEAEALLLKISDAAPRNGFVVLSGGVAPGMGDDFPQRVQSALEGQTDRLVVDTSKTPLMHLISSPKRPVHVLRLDRSEVETAAQHPIQTIEENFAFASNLVNRGVARIVVTGHGAKGSLLVSGQERLFCRAPLVEERSKIGAGDALVGALSLSLSRGEPPEQALKWGVAAAAATVGTEGTALCDLGMTEALLPECVVEKR
ncbi:MAG: hexose kinase [Dinoroseobacter sp.]|nr:hexose kinase [Dinoroseobacter sp.]